jgi:hypothetical protein
MRQDIKQEWVKRLRSGIRQTSGVLATGDARCAMGVLCDIAVEHKVIQARPIFEEDGVHVLHIVYGDDGFTVSAPYTVLHWADLTLSESLHIEELNDCRCTFEEIATYIEENL